MKKTLFIAIIFLAASVSASSFGGQFGTLKVGKNSSYYVAAYNAPILEKLLADYICDGTDDDVQIQAAIDAIVVPPGGEIGLSAGTFSIGSPVLVKERIGIIGEGQYCTILEAESGYEDNIIEFAPTGSGLKAFFHMENLTIWGNSSGTTGHGIYMTDDNGGNPSDWHFDHIYVRECAQDGLNTECCWGGKITNSIFETNQGCGAVIGDDKQFTMDGCFIAYNEGDYGLSITGNGCSIRGCFIYQNKKYGAYSNGIGNTWIGNTFYDNGKLTANTYEGLRIYTAGHRSVVTGNYFYGASNEKYGINVAAYDCEVTGNVFYFYDTAPITVSGKGTNVHGNTIVGSPSDAFQWDMRNSYFKNTSGGSLTNGNVVIAAATGENYDGTQCITTTTLGDDRVLGMARETIADDATGRVLMLGKTNALKVDGTDDIAVGDYLCTFTTAKIACKANAGDMAFAIALEAYATDDSAGVIDAILISPRKLD